MTFFLKVWNCARLEVNRKVYMLLEASRLGKLSYLLFSWTKRTRNQETRGSQAGFYRLMQNLDYKI